MKDSHGRDINYLRISVTDRCNLRCYYCMPNGVTKLSHEDIIRDEDIIQIVTEAVKTGITKIRITGGDPLVRKGIYQLIRKIKDIKGVQEVVLSTNGLLLLGHVHKLQVAGISRVNFSLDTLNPETYKKITQSEVPLDYSALIEELLAHKMVPVKINAVLLRGVNDHEIPDFIELANRYDILVRFIELMPMGDIGLDYDTYFIGKDEVLQHNPQLEFTRKEIIAEYYKVPGKQGEIGFISPITHEFCDQCNRLRLTSQGHLLPCLLHDHDVLVKSKSSTEILEALKEAIQAKDKGHNLNDEIKAVSKKSMNKIGG